VPENGFREGMHVTARSRSPPKAQGEKAFADPRAQLNSQCQRRRASANRATRGIEIVTIAIQPDRQRLTSGRFQSFSERWIERLLAGGYHVRTVDAYGPALFDQLRGCDAFMWWFAHMPLPRNPARRVVQAVEHGLRIPVFPTWRTIWHFDDKIAQYYLLSAAGIPMPSTWVLWRRDQALEFCRTAQYPLVIKLASGITSENVALVRNCEEARHWITQLFDFGVTDLVRERVHPWTVLRRIRQSLRVLTSGQQRRPSDIGRTELQRGYVLLQEFIPHNDFDTRITVIGNRAFAFRRLNRPSDFRASGSGLRDDDPTRIDLDSVRLAFQVAERLETQSVAVDVLYRDGARVLTEISYYYEAWVVQQCPGHWELAGRASDGELHWVEGQVPPEDAILADFLATIGRGQPPRT
jgi:hypothetical protein